MSKILIIDDDEMLRIILRDVLESEGHEVMEASDGCVGMALFRENSPDLIIADILMPGTDGIETITELRKDYPDVKIIAISGGNQRDEIDFLDYAEILGARRTLAKPLELDELMEVVEQVLAEKINPVKKA